MNALYDDEDVQVFKHYLELCDNDPVRAFIAYRNQFIVPLREEVNELTEKAKRNPGDRIADISQFIDYVKKLEPSEKITYKSYKTYCKIEGIKKWDDNKFYELRPFAIRRILLDEMPRHFSLQQAETILTQNGWRIRSEYIKEALADDVLFIELPMSDDERQAFLRTDTDKTPIYFKVSNP